MILAAELTNDDVPLQGITVGITAEPAFIKPCSARFELLAPSSVTDMCQSLVPELDLTYMASVRQSQKATVTLSVADQSGNILKSTSATTEILPYGYWPVQYMPESIAASVMPASACLEQVRKLMSDTLGHWGRGTELAGYAGDVNSVQDLGAAAFSALKRFNIAYSNPPEGFETSGYRIRLPEEVLGRREGNCLDMAVLYASVLESVGLNTVLFVSKGYVFAGFWLVDDHMSDIICTDASRFTR